MIFVILNIRLLKLVLYTHHNFPFFHIQSGLTPLHLAAQEDKVNVAEVLLNHGADVNPQTKVALSPQHTCTDIANTQVGRWRFDAFLYFFFFALLN